MKTKLALLSLSFLSCLAFATVAWAHGQGHDGHEGTEAAVPADEEENAATGEDVPTLEPKAESETDESDEDTMGSAE